ncbi:uncharacterized protein DEA37_0012331 [Paragonimus westermani]|uniref:Uncharacterized protein n=1 Tax=Paragonimus westermani TaxID=34504 RepID=A0A5J4NPP7_9TREM|nr:uncharacterized protein DEA37_0012331 [Paragonimus westermani]
MIRRLRACWSVSVWQIVSHGCRKVDESYMEEVPLMKSTEAFITEMTSAFELFLSKFEDFGKVLEGEEIEGGTANKETFFCNQQPQISSLCYQEELKRALSKVGLSLTDYEDAENNAPNHRDTKDGSAKHDSKDLRQLIRESTSSEGKQKPTMNSVDFEEPIELNMMTGDRCNTSADAVKNDEYSYNTDGCKALAEKQIEEVAKKDEDIELCKLPQDLEEQIALEKAEIGPFTEKNFDYANCVQDCVIFISTLATGRTQFTSLAALADYDAGGANFLFSGCCSLYRRSHSQIQCTRTPERERSKSADPLLAHAKTYFNLNVETECILEPASGFLSASGLEDFSMMVQTELDEVCTPTLSSTSPKQQHETPTSQPNAQTKSTGRNTIHAKHKREPLMKQLESDVRNVGDLVSSKQKNLSNKQTKTVDQSENGRHSRLYPPNAPRGTVKHKQDNYETGVCRPVVGDGETVQTSTSNITPITHTNEFCCPNKLPVQIDHDVYAENTHPVNTQLSESTFVPKTIHGITSEHSK